MPVKSIKSFAAKTTKSSVHDVVWEKVKLKIVNPLGLHTRAACSFVKTAQQFPGQIRVQKNKTYANGKSILSLLTLAAKQGDIITVRTKGKKAKEALQNIRALIEAGFHE